MKNKIKICHVISGYYRTDARVFQRQCKSLVASGFEVSLLTNDGEPSETIDEIKVFEAGRFWSSRLKVLLFAKKQFLRKALEIDADIYQMHSPELLSLGRTLQKKGKRVVYDAHEDLPRHLLEKEWLPQVLRGPFSWVVEWYMNKLLSKYDSIISPHSHVVEYLEKVNPNVRLIANFPLVQYRKKFELDDYLKRGKKLCYTGTVYLYSNQEVILEAISIIDDVQYEVPGYFQPEHLESLKNRVGYDKLNFLGRLTWEQMIEFYNHAAVGIVVYDYKYNLGYNLGSYGTNKIFEYMEAAIPIICTDYILWKNIVDRYNCGICVQPGNLDQIRNALVFLFENPVIAYEMGQNGRRAVQQEFNWKSQEEIYNALFIELSSKKI